MVVAVQDPTDSQPNQRGKQVLKPGFIWYTPISGIWQTVWLEPVADKSITSIKLTPDLDQGKLNVSATVLDLREKLTLSARTFANGELVTQGQGDASSPLTLKIENPIPWSPEKPFLYDLEIELLRDGKAIDKVSSYFGMRKFSLEKTARAICASA